MMSRRLPPGWSRRVSTRNGKDYYWHISGVSMWRRPSDEDRLPMVHGKRPGEESPVKEAEPDPAPFAPADSAAESKDDKPVDLLASSILGRGKTGAPTPKEEYQAKLIKFRGEVEAALKKLDGGEVNVLRFPDIDKTHRYIVDEEADEYEFVTESIGQGSHQTAVVYRAGFTPPEVVDRQREEDAVERAAEEDHRERTERMVAMSEQAKAARRTAPVIPVMKVVVPLFKKKDRRSAAEIQEAIKHNSKRRRMANAEEVA